jgi:hypothetical protein
MVFLKRIVTQSVRNSLMFQKPRVHHQVHKGSSLDIVGQLNPVYTLTSNLSKVHIIPPTYLNTSQVLDPIADVFLPNICMLLPIPL